jgi:D-lyxose ketol-isomerase
MEEGVQFCRAMKFCLPPFAFWNREDWADKGLEYDEIRDNLLGWDITDFGSGAFERCGLLMFTIRNGSLDNPAYRKPYAEKLLIVREGQLTPCHYHYQKMEDIINRGGGNLLVKVYNRAEDDGLDCTGDVQVSVDGRNHPVPAGTVLTLGPGESITLPTGMYHSFWGEPGKGTVLVGEVSKVNDDRVDNHFLEPVGRFPEIEEDAEPLYLMSNDYPTF